MTVDLNTGGRDLPAAPSGAVIAATPSPQPEENSGITSVEVLNIKKKLPRFRSITVETPTYVAKPEPHKVDLQSLLGGIKHTADALIGIIDLAKEIDRVGNPRSGRSIVAGEDLMPISVGCINQRRKSSSNAPNPGEMRMLHVFAKANGSKLPLTDWHVVTANLIELGSRNDALPGPEVYLKESDAGREPSQALRIQLDELNGVIQLMRQSPEKDEGAAGDKTLAKITERDDVIAALDKMLYDTTDVDPRDVDACCENHGIFALPKPEVIEALVAFQASLGDLIKKMVLSQKDTQPPTVHCAEFIGKDVPQTTLRRVEQISQFSLVAAPLLEGDRDKNLAYLLTEHARVQSALVDAYQAYKGLSLANEPKKREAYQRMERALSAYFCGDASVSREIFVALDSNKDATVRKLLPKALIAQTLESERSSKTIKSFLDQKENIELLGQALAHLIRGDDDTASLIEASLAASTLRPVVDLGVKVRTLMKADDPDKVITYFDNELKKMGSTDNYSSFTQKAVLLHAMVIASDDPLVRRRLKGRLKNSDIVNQLSKSMGGKLVVESSPHARFLEGLRSEINRRASFDLSDYWGHKALVKEWTELILEHLELLSDPKAAGSIPPDEVYMNAFLLYGGPGSGKTFFSTCIANELRLSKTTITRKEMAAALKKGGNVDDGKLETAFAEFMEGKIKEAEEDRKKSGAIAAMIFMDEMEGEFLKRNPATSPREDLIRTNIMLTVIESLIKKHPEIIFVGATNHIEIVDPAALRTGRLGIHLCLDMPEKEDVLDILDGIFNRADIVVPEEVRKGETYNKLVEMCIHMPPLEIKHSVNNPCTLQRKRSGMTELTLDDALIGKCIKKAESIKKHKYKEKKAVNTVEEPAA